MEVGYRVVVSVPALTLLSEVDDRVKAAVRASFGDAVSVRREWALPGPPDEAAGVDGELEKGAEQRQAENHEPAEGEHEVDG
jgi:hypothetical protein